MKKQSAVVLSGGPLLPASCLPALNEALSSSRKHCSLASVCQVACEAAASSRQLQILQWLQSQVHIQLVVSNSLCSPDAPCLATSCSPHVCSLLAEMSDLNENLLVYSTLLPTETAQALYTSSSALSGLKPTGITCCLFLIVDILVCGGDRWQLGKQALGTWRTTCMPASCCHWTYWSRCWRTSPTTGHMFAQRYMPSPLLEIVHEDFFPESAQ